MTRTTDRVFARSGGAQAVSLCFSAALPKSFWYARNRSFPGTRRLSASCRRLQASSLCSSELTELRSRPGSWARPRCRGNPWRTRWSGGSRCTWCRRRCSGCSCCRTRRERRSRRGRGRSCYWHHRIGVNLAVVYTSADNDAVFANTVCRRGRIHREIPARIWREQIGKPIGHVSVIQKRDREGRRIGSHHPAGRIDRTRIPSLVPIASGIATIPP